MDPDALQAEVAKGLGDGAVLEWISAHARPARGGAEIAAWSAWQEQRVPGDVESRAFLHETHRQAAAHREDIVGWFDLLDLDDYVSFGGKA